MTPSEEAACATALWVCLGGLLIVSRILGLVQRIEGAGGRAYRARGNIIKEMARAAAWYDPGLASLARQVIEDIDRRTTAKHEHNDNG